MQKKSKRSTPPGLESTIVKLKAALSDLQESNECLRRAFPIAYAETNTEKKRRPTSRIAARRSN